MKIPNHSLSITIILAVRNEAANIARCLQACGPAARVVVVDSNSVDETAALAQRQGAEVVQFKHAGGYPKKRQWALNTLAIETDWVLFLDADEVVPGDLWLEIQAAIVNPEEHRGFLIRKGFHFLGRRFEYGGFSHQAVLLVRTGHAKFEELVEMPGDSLDMEVHERVMVDGEVGRLLTPLIHEDFKGLEAYIDRHNRYSSWEAFVRHQWMTTGRYGSQSVQARLLGNAQERRRWLKKIAVRVPLEPWLWFLYHYVARLGVLEGRAGLIACQIRQQYISNVRAKMHELRRIE